MNKLIKSLTKKAAYLLAIFIIIAALVVCAIRFLTPILDGHRADFENIAGKFLQTPVKIGSVRVSWFRYQPVISLNDVSILDRTSKEEVFRVDKISLLISFLDSLWQRQVITSGIMASGAELNIRQSASGELTVKEFSSLPFNQQQGKSEAKFIEVMGWLSHEPYLILSNIDVYYTGVGKQNRFVTLYHLDFHNTETEHTIAGKAVLHQDLPTEISLAAKWKGKIEDFPQIKAKAYLYISGLSLAQWAKGVELRNWQIKNGIVSAKIWVDWEQGGLQRIQAAFKSFGLEFYSDTDKTLHRINRASGNLGWKREANHQIFAGDDILLDLPARLWPVTSFSVAVTPDAKGALIPDVIHVGYLDLADMQAWLHAVPAFLPDDSMKMLAAMKIRGVVQHLVLTFPKIWNDWKHLELAANFSQLDIAPYEKYPGVEDLAGSFKWNGRQGEVKLNSRHTLLNISSIFNHPMLLDQLTGEMQIEHQNSAWLFNIASFNMLNADMAANANGSIKYAANSGLVTDIKANATVRQAKHITRYLPQSVFDKSLNEWLKDAFLSGEVTSAHAVLRGALKDFPFDKGNGEFVVASKINNIDFRFADNWPILRHVSGDLTFTGRQLMVNVDHADTLGLPITNVRGVIPYLGDARPQILSVTTSPIQSDFAQAMRYVHTSPLEKNIGKMFADVDLQGSMTLTLGLSIPLSHPDDTKVNGSILLDNNVMNLAPWNLKLEKLNGKIGFTENSTQGKNIQAELFGKPLQFNLTTVQKAKNQSVVQASFSNQFDLMDIETWLKLPLSKVVRGDALINGVINLSLALPLEIQLNSNLVGVAIDLPDEYGKKANEARETSADLILQTNQPMRIRLNYGKLLSTALILDRKQDKYHLLSANLRFGNGIADWPASTGIYITGELDTLDAEKLGDLNSQPSGNTDFSLDKLKEIDLNIKQINLGAQKLNQANLHVYPEPTAWDIHIDSQEVSGQLTVPKKIKRQTLISAQFEKMNLHAAEGKKLQLDVKSLPALSLAANNVRYNDIPIGNITFNAMPASFGLVIKSLRITSPNVDLRASGEWKQNGKGSITHLQGGVTSVKVSRLLKNFGMDVTNFLSDNGSMNFNLAWPDAPFAPSLATMSGRTSLVLGPGRIVDLGEENNAKMDIGRMLSIFSLQTIPRRLSLDFSDIFQKGYSFDSLRGDFVIDDGDVTTNNMRFDGPVAKVGINGRIGLKNKDYNFILSVTAHVTSSIPVAATLLTGNPLIGIGAFAVNTMLGANASGVITNYYSVTGPWSHPVWKSIKNNKIN